MRNWLRSLRPQPGTDILDKHTSTPITLAQCRDPVILFAAGFGSGCSPKAPGTMGTIVALPLVWLAQPMGIWVYLAITLVVTLAGICLAGQAAERLGVHDHPGIVIDEIAGMLITMIAVPSGWPWLLAGFVLFRLFDILKPWPISVLDRRVSGGFGIMVDDIIAGVMALAVLHVAAYYLSL